MNTQLCQDGQFDHGNSWRGFRYVRNQHSTGKFRDNGVAGSLIALLMSFIASSFALAEEQSTVTVAEESPNVTVYVGVRDDAKPFSYIDITRNSESVIPGYSGYSVEVCRHILKKMKTLPKYRNFDFKAGNIKATERFKELGNNGKLFMLCGPDSITKDRLVDYWASQPFFLSGLTYAYLNPRSPKFPQGNYCDNIIGVVRGTTADTEGLPDIAARGLLMRFNEALNLEINKTSGRIAESRKKLRELIRKEIFDDWLQQTVFGRQLDNVDAPLRSEKHTLAEFESLENANLVDLSKALDELADKGNSLARKVKSLMVREHGLLNERVARTIKTDECPSGFASLPVRKYESHDSGVEGFCNGDVLYYLADYDILKNKTEEISDCDVVMNRFTRSREVYGAFFSKDYMFFANADDNTELQINAAGFYANFNNFLTMSMQGQFSDIERIFSEEFGEQEMSNELAIFFDSLKIE